MSGERSGLAPGDKAPDIEGITLDNAHASLRSQSAKLYLVNFWASWCAPCIAELPALQNLYSKLKGRGFTIVGVAIDDTVEPLAALRAQYKVTYPVLLDYEGKGKRAYEIKGVPESYVLDSQFRILMITDPSSGTPLTKLTGAREWDSQGMVSLFESLLALQPPAAQPSAALP